MPKRREEQKQQRSAARASAKGECVFYALLAGVSDLSHVQTHVKLLATIRSKLRSPSSCLDQVTWNGAPLSAQEVAEFRHAVLFNIHVADGYTCSACDALLVAYCAAFRVDVVHDFAGIATDYNVPLARRTVYLSSSIGHMEHERNEDLPVPDGGTNAETKKTKVSCADPKAEPAVSMRPNSSPQACFAVEGADAGTCLQQPTLDDLRTWRFEDAPSCHGQWVLVEAECCPVTVGILRPAQGRTQMKVLTRDGSVVFFPRAGALLTAFATPPRDDADAAHQALVLTRRRLSLLAPPGAMGSSLARVMQMLPDGSLRAVSAASLAWHGLAQSFDHDVTLVSRAEPESPPQAASDAFAS